MLITKCTEYSSTYLMYFEWILNVQTEHYKLAYQVWVIGFTSALNETFFMEGLMKRSTRYSLQWSRVDQWTLEGTSWRMMKSERLLWEPCYCKCQWKCLWPWLMKSCTSTVWLYQMCEQRGAGSWAINMLLFILFGGVFLSFSCCVFFSDTASL